MQSGKVEPKNAFYASRKKNFIQNVYSTYTWRFSLSFEFDWIECVNEIACFTHQFQRSLPLLDFVMLFACSLVCRCSCCLALAFAHSSAARNFSFYGSYILFFCIAFYSLAFPLPRFCSLILLFKLYPRSFFDSLFFSCTHFWCRRLFFSWVFDARFICRSAILIRWLSFRKH